MGWPVYPEIRFEESANGPRCFRRPVLDLEARLQAPKACRGDRAEASSHASASMCPEERSDPCLA